MDRAEERVEKPAEENSQDASERLMDSVRSDRAPVSHAKPLNVEKESQSIADLFDLGKSNGDYDQHVNTGTARLSDDLRHLTGNMDKYNQLLGGVSDKIPDEPAANPGLELHDWNAATGTWDKVTVGSGDTFDAYRIVQPYNTLSQIAADTYKDFVDGAKFWGRESEVKTELGSNWRDYMAKLVEINKIANPDKIYVGQAIKLREHFTWTP